MITRFTFWLAFLSATLVTTVAADDAIEFTLGKASDGIDVYRLAWRKPWSSRWLVSDIGEFTGYHVVSFNYWKGGNDSVHAIAYSPVFVYRFNEAPITYLKFGIGGAYLSETTIENRNLSSYLQFEDQVGMGWAWDVHDLSLVYMHYSNGGIEDPNHGINMLVLSYARRL